MAIQHSNGTFLFPRYLSSVGIRSTHASNALNLWLKPRFGGLTAHSLRHTMRDRLRAVAAPIEMIDQIGGWSSINTAGSQYGDGFSVDHIREWMEKIRIK